MKHKLVLSSLLVIMILAGCSTVDPIYSLDLLLPIYARVGKQPAVKNAPHPYFGEITESWDAELGPRTYQFYSSEKGLTRVVEGDQVHLYAFNGLEKVFSGTSRITESWGNAQDIQVISGSLFPIQVGNSMTYSYADLTKEVRRWRVSKPKGTRTVYVEKMVPADHLIEGLPGYIYIVRREGTGWPQNELGPEELWYSDHLEWFIKRTEAQYKGKLISYKLPVKITSSEGETTTVSDVQPKEK